MSQITSRLREQLDAALEQSSTARAAAARRQRILLKLGAYWAAHPHDTLANLLDTAITQHSARDCGLSWASSDALIEESLDGALKADGLSVTGGWKS